MRIFLIYYPNENLKNGLKGIELLNLKRSEVPAITHVDYSARIQTVSKNKNERFYKLISSFKRRTNLDWSVRSIQ